MTLYVQLLTYPINKWGSIRSFKRLIYILLLFVDHQEKFLKKKPVVRRVDVWDGMNVNDLGTKYN